MGENKDDKKDDVFGLGDVAENVYGMPMSGPFRELLTKRAANMRPLLTRINHTVTKVVGFYARGEAGQTVEIQVRPQERFRITKFHATDWTDEVAAAEPGLVGFYRTDLSGARDVKDLPELPKRSGFLVVREPRVEDGALMDEDVASIAMRLEFVRCGKIETEHVLADAGRLLRAVRERREAERRAVPGRLCPAPGTVTAVESVFLGNQRVVGEVGPVPTSDYAGWSDVDWHTVEACLPITLMVYFREAGHFAGAFWGKVLR